ncbi:MAG: hypothetical protein AAGA66_15650 [Bacteroidota bacterium]
MSDNKVVYVKPDADAQWKGLLTALDSTTKGLTIVVEGNKDTGWMVGPPLSAGDFSLKSIHDYDFFLDTLPVNGADLKELVYLDISSLGLNALPNFSDFPKLESLDISFNPVNIKDEIQNISSLKSLKVLNIQGCDFDENDVSSLNEKKNGLTILHLFNQNPRHFFHQKPFIASPVEKLKLALLTDIHRYYPVGLPFLNKQSSQYQAYKTVLDSSAFSLQNESKEDKWYQLLNELKTRLKKEEVRNHSSIAFPSRSLHVPLGEEKNAAITERKSLKLEVSLLTNRYTIYFESLITFKNYEEFGKKPVRTTFIHGEKNASNRELELVKEFKRMVPEFYTGYQFVNHKLAMETKIEGAIPYESEIETWPSESLVFTLLFGPKQLVNSKILE